jgi:hypothetical protein
MLTCGARDAHEKGGDRSVNVYGLAAEDEVGARLGLIPGDPGAADASTDPETVTSTGTEVLEETGESAGSAPDRKSKGKDVPS